MTDSPPEAVCDAGPPIHLDELDCLDLLADFDAVLVPEQVREEVARHRPAALAPTAFELLLLRAFALDLGEQAALTLARSRAGAILLTDDAAARLAAKALGLRAYGTVGVLLRAIRRGRRSRGEVLKLLRDLPARSTLHIRPAGASLAASGLIASVRLVAPEHPQDRQRGRFRVF